MIMRILAGRRQALGTNMKQLTIGLHLLVLFRAPLPQKPVQVPLLHLIEATLLQAAGAIVITSSIWLLREVPMLLVETIIGSKSVQLHSNVNSAPNGLLEPTTFYLTCVRIFHLSTGTRKCFVPGCPTLDQMCWIHCSNPIRVNT
jgi:hypothetical protein